MSINRSFYREICERYAFIMKRGYVPDCEVAMFVLDESQNVGLPSFSKLAKMSSKRQKCKGLGSNIIVLDDVDDFV